METTTKNTERVYPVLYRAGEDNATNPPRANFMGHDDAFCESIPVNPKRWLNDMSVSMYFEQNEWFDGEIAVGNIVDCNRCVKFVTKDNGFGGTTTVKNALRETERITDRQIPYLTDLAAKRPIWAAKNGLAADTIPNLPKNDAKRLISEALTIKPEKTEFAVTPVPAAPKPNRYGGKCCVCKEYCLPGEGTCEKADNGKWQVSHTECPENPWGIMSGYYAVPTDEGHLAFYFVSVRGIMLQAGPQFREIPESVQDAVARKILIDPKEAALTYGREIGRCCRCYLELTNEESREYGIGPICRGKWGW
jgi:hypothetical protein